MRLALKISPFVLNTGISLADSVQDIFYVFPEIYFKVRAPPHSRFSKQSKPRTVSKTALIKCRQMQCIS